MPRPRRGRSPRRLLARRPDSVLEQPGRLVPDEHGQWGRFGLSGWLDWTGRGAQGAPFVWSDSRVARLELPACAPADRTLGLRFWMPAVEGSSRAGSSVSVRLNGVEVGSVEAELAPRTFEFSAPASLWHEGRNVLELESAGLRASENGKPRSLALAEVLYDRERRVEPDPGAARAALDPGTAVTYLVAPRGKSELYVACASRARGVLAARIRFLNAGDARPAAVADRSLLLPLADAGDGMRHLSRRVPLPDAGDGLLEIELRWLAGDGERAPLELERAALLGSLRADRPSILLVSVDTVAASHMSVYGYSRPTTPSLEKLAAEAIVFERCTANAPWTLPSYLSMMTGLFPGAHRVDAPEPAERELWEEWHIAGNRLTLAELLRAAGYQTAGFVDSLFLGERFGVPQGFDTFDSSAAEIDKADPGGGFQRVAALARSWLDCADPGMPFFLLLHADVHGPYTPEEPWRGRFSAGLEDGPSVRAGGFGNAFGTIPAYIARGVVPVGPLPEWLPTAPIVAAYDEGLLCLDAHLGAFLDRLRDGGVLDRCALVVNADHGESDVHHNFYFGHGVLYEDVLHVPLLVRLPEGRGGGRRVETPVQSVDLYPTLAELAGLRPRHDLHGRSLVSL